MAAPYRNKHFLEMSDREREARRLAELQRPGRDAIESVYPETELVLAARGLKAALAARKMPNKELLFNQPMPKEVLAAEARFSPEAFEHVGKHLQKELRAKEKTRELVEEYIREKRRPAMRKRMQQRQIEKPRKDAERALTDVLSRTAYTAILGPREDEFSCGGVVKVKKHRGDGVIKRGGTKGRFV